MLYPMITIDYEIFGDGSGSIKKTILDPMEEILRIFDKHNVKCNIMFEFEEYKKISELQDHKKYRKDLKEWERQIERMHESGHDIQLHFHPQFMEAEFINNEWKVNETAYSIRHYIEEMGDNKGKSLIKKELQKGISIIRELVKDKNHEVIAYRAGGWNLDPEDIYINILKEIGIKIDTSSVKGAVMKSGKHGYDYRKLPSNVGYWWTKGDSIREIGKTGENLIEMPIYALNFNPLSPKRVKIMKTMNDKVKDVDYGHGGGGSYGLKEIYYSVTSSIKWDFCKLSSDQMEFFYRKALSLDREYETVPLVMIGHTKDFNNSTELDKFLKNFNAKFENEFHTFRDVSEKIA